MCNRPCERTGWSGSPRAMSAVLCSVALLAGGRVVPAQTTVVAWNDLGMHCIDPDFAVFSILPPFNNVNVHVIHNGQLVTSGSGWTVTYEGTADPGGSINTTSIGKSNFWDHADELFGVTLPLDMGLAGHAMPGPANIPQAMDYVPTWQWFHAEGIPITPRDDGLDLNPYPLMKVKVQQAGQEVASTVTTVPNSQELQCSQCHASGASRFARPSAGWVFDADPLRDDRLNILRLHDELQASDPAYAAALSQAGYDPAGLFETATAQATAVLCARCHGSNALPGTGLPGISPLTEAVHGFHGSTVNPEGQVLDQSTVRTACYSCHPGFETRCVRGAMGRAVGPDGEFSMQCQSCHGNLSAVGEPGRIGWLDQIGCQNCHTGSATHNSGQIRYLSAFDGAGQPRAAADPLFATTPDVPAPGFSLYRFSSGHGGLQCSACHGPPHAIYPTDFENDNLQMMQLQGHPGSLTDCNVCHQSLEDDEIDGPHGMHPVDLKWVRDNHKDAVGQRGLGHCQSCHGADLKGTVLSRAQGDRVYDTRDFGVKSFWRGFQVGCYACHDGPDDEDPASNHAPVVSDQVVSTPADQPASIVLMGGDADGDPLQYRVVSKPLHGKVAWQGNQATYAAEPGYLGADFFTYAASDGTTDSNRATVDIDVTAPLCPGGVEPYGFPCPGSGDFLPRLGWTGCPTPGAVVTVDIRQGLGGSLALLLAGTARDVLELPGGCILRVAPAVRVATLRLAGSGPGMGSVSFTATISPGLPAQSIHLQALVFDPGVPGKFSATEALEIQLR